MRIVLLFILAILFFGCSSMNDAYYELDQLKEYSNKRVMDKFTSVAIDTSGKLWINYHNNLIDGKVTGREPLFKE